jgi:hypothetical protein
VSGGSLELFEAVPVVTCRDANVLALVILSAHELAHGLMERESY